MDGSKRGIKRKRYEPQQEELGVKVKGKLHHDLREVKKAAKKAKIFETQKLVKRLKDLRKGNNKSNEIVGVEAELASMKAVDPETIAITALKSKLNKDRTLSGNEHVQIAVLQELGSNLLIPDTLGTPGSKVQSRLLSSKILAVGIAAVVEDLKNVLQPKTTSTAEILERNIESLTKQKKKSVDFTPLVTRNDQEDVDGLTPEFGEDNEASWESGTVGGSEEEQMGWESGSLTGGDNESDDEPDGGSDVFDENSQIIPSVAKHPTSLPKKAVPTRPASKPAGLQSTFLPTLSVGFIRGSDDSEMSENEIKAADIDIKKNRRGQRARRAIWEKKYGRNANHKKKESGSRLSSAGGQTLLPSPNYPQHTRKAGRDPPETRRTETKPLPQHRQGADSGWGQRTAKGQVFNPGAVLSTRPTKEDKSIHPSWEAKRKLKEKESASIVPSQGKKIKFN